MGEKITPDSGEKWYRKNVDSVLGYAEYQMTDNTGSTTDTDQMALGLKYTF